MQNFSSIVKICDKKVRHSKHRKKYAHANYCIEDNCGNSLIEFNVHSLHVKVVVGEYILRVNYFAFSLKQELKIKLGLVVEARFSL